MKKYINSVSIHSLNVSAHEMKSSEVKTASTAPYHKKYQLINMLVANIMIHYDRRHFVIFKKKKITFYCEA
jgi:hypothetical protein